jgi:hypothetical protein
MEGQRMKNSIEKQSSYIVKCNDNRLRVYMSRDDNSGHDYKINDTISWTDHSVWTWPKYSGIIIAFRHNDWDYKLPVGQRCLNLNCSENFIDLLKSIK